MPNDSLEQQALDRVARMYSSYDRRTGRSVQIHNDRTDRGSDDRGRNPSSDTPRPSRDDDGDRSSQPSADSDGFISKSSGTDNKAPGFLGALMEDKEQSLIMLLLVILMKDGADLNMILALMYLLI